VNSSLAVFQLLFEVCDSGVELVDGMNQLEFHLPEQTCTVLANHNRSGCLHASLL